MSQSLPIPAQRWLSLLLCAITAAAITVFLSNVSFVRQAYASWGSILYANSVLHYSFAFLSGIGIKLMLDKFYISHAKRSIGFNWRYPPVTISVLFGLLFIVGYVYFTYSNEIVEQLTAHAFLSFKFLSLSFLAVAATIIYQTKLYTKNPIFSVVLCAVSVFYLFSAINLVEIEHTFCVFFCIAAAYFFMSVCLLLGQLSASNTELIVESKQEAELTLESLEHFQQWFKDDSTIKNTEQLEPDLRIYANRIADRLLKRGDQGGDELKGAQHIALCGPFGCGKSSIVDSIASELAKSPVQDGIWIHSDISTWGAASGSVAHVVLSHIIDDISQHLDMCAFRALPKHYTEALKSGGSLFQFASTLLAGPVDIELSFQKLNDVLEVTNHKLLITLQDVDRGTGDENEKRLNDIAALLDRLKNRSLSHINFIVAMGNDKPEHLEVLGKVADHIESIITVDFKEKLCDWTKLCVQEISNNDMVSLNVDVANRFSFSKTIYQPAIISNQLISSIRMLKRIMRRIDLCWNEGNLLGEVDFDSLFMLTTLREVNPSLFTAFVKLYPSLINDKPQPVANSEDRRRKTINETLLELISDFTSDGAAHVYNAFFKKLLNLKEDIQSANNERSDNVDQAAIQLIKVIASNYSQESVRSFYDLVAPKVVNKNGTKDTLTSARQCISVKYVSVDYLNRVLLETVPVSELRDQEALKCFREITPESVKKIASDIATDNRWLVAFERFHFHVDEACKKSLTYEILNQQIFANRKLFETNGALHKLIYEEMCNGSFKDILNKLVEIEPAQLLLSGVVKQFFEIEYMSHKLPSLELDGTDNNQYYNVKDRAVRKVVADKTKLWTQHMDISVFLDSNIDKLNPTSIEVLIKLLTFTQLESFNSKFVEQRVKNIFELYSKTSSQSTVNILIEILITPNDAERNPLLDLINTQSKDFKCRLKSRIENANREQQDIERTIEILGL